VNWIHVLVVVAIVNPVGWWRLIVTNSETERVWALRLTISVWPIYALSVIHEWILERTMQKFEEDCGKQPIGPLWRIGS